MFHAARRTLPSMCPSPMDSLSAAKINLSLTNLFPEESDGNLISQSFEVNELNTGIVSKDVKISAKFSYTP
ncbi:hypothetical protein O6P43_012399 [Quillaja saponaria]|uniref:Uncharacterized protein n=1 Tax=Quillaja saponaria TaxID=32244 RepID=A0AAD7M1K7_QUISA|nr:hypothetical protein O6P43_012399 [Quillaja saponaria]